MPWRFLERHGSPFPTLIPNPFPCHSLPLLAPPGGFILAGFIHCRLGFHSAYPVTGLP